MARRSAQPRSDGPAVVFGGGPSADELLVLDPAGAGKHDGPPASWRELGRIAHVTWLRLPAIDTPVATAREKLAELAASGRRVHLLAGGEAAPLAELLALERPQALTSMLLVDPPQEPAGGLVSNGATVTDQALLAHRSAPARQELAGHGVTVRVLTYADAERADRGAPLPLGHPRVVVALRRQLRDRRRRLRRSAKRQPATVQRVRVQKDKASGLRSRLRQAQAGLRRLASRTRRRASRAGE